MRFLSAFIITFATAGLAFSQEGQPKAVTATLDLSYYQNAWGMKVKSTTLDFLDQKMPDGSMRSVARISYTLEFGRDIVNYDLDELQRTVVFRKDGEERKIRHIFFDEDNVAFFVQYAYQFLDGDVSGVKGESFRIILELRPDVVQASKRIVARPGLGHR